MSFIMFKLIIHGKSLMPTVYRANVLDWLFRPPETARLHEISLEFRLGGTGETRKKERQRRTRAKALVQRFAVLRTVKEFATLIRF